MFDLTYLGHAGWRVVGNDFKAIFDPWFNPSGTFMNSWHQFPDNSFLLDEQLFDELDFLYISHAHQDHFDEWTLKRVNRKTDVLIPNFRDKTLRNKLKRLGFSKIKEMREGTKTSIKGVEIEMIVEDGFNDRDSAIILNDGENKIINLNDCHPSFGKISKYSEGTDLLLMQCSSAIWWPCVYDYTPEQMKNKCRTKRQNVLNRALKYSKHVKAKYVVPNAGPPVFLHDRFKFWDETRHRDFNPFLLHDEVKQFLSNNGSPSLLIVPGETIKVNRDSISNTTCPVKVQEIYGNIDQYLRKMREDKKRRGLLKERFVPEQNLDNLVDKFSSLIRDIRKNSRIFIHKINFPILINFRNHSKWIIDFAKDENECFKEYEDQQHMYSFTFDPEIVSYLINQEQIDFDEYFLSMRFECSRKEDVFNEFLFTMFKNLDLKRFKLSESIYISENMRKTDNLETFVVNVSGEPRKVQKMCPHQFIDLEKCGIINGNVLTCPLHNWKFDLETGACLTSDKYSLSIEKL